MAEFANTKFVSYEALNYAIVKVDQNYVRKEEGKGLSTCDFTTELRDKLVNDVAYVHPKSEVTPGTYTKVTVDEYGHVTAAESPTTLAGYGITDAAALNHTHDVASMAEFVTSEEIDAMFQGIAVA